MKTMKNLLSMAALALVGAMTVGCSSDDNIIDTPQQPVAKSNVVTMTTTVGLDGGAATRALTTEGVKTFVVDDKIAVVYETNDGTKAKVESTALTTDDISADGKTAKFTVTLTDAKESGAVKYIYPAAMAGETDVDYTKLASQDGTLDNLGKNLDLAVFNGDLTAEAKLPASVSLENKLAILAITLQDNAPTPNDLTSSTTALTVKDGTNTYEVNRSTGAGPIYVAICPNSSANITITATAGAKKYGKYLTSKTYAASNGYPVSWEMYKMAASAESGDLEKLLCTAGHIHADGADPKCTATRVAKIFYVGSETCEGTGFNHGLALGLTDASTGCSWGLMGRASNAERYNEKTFQPESGLMYNTYYIEHNNDNYPAFKNAIAYNGGVAPAECSAWFLPSAYQLKTMMDAVATDLTPENYNGHIKLREKADLDDSAATGYYWVCTETGASLALRYYFGDGNFYYVSKDSNRRVRSCCAF